MKNTLIFSAIFVLLSTSRVFAVSESPSFPLCPNPGGSQTSGYTTGDHGIAGKPGVYNGSDSVFKIDDNRTVQCYCDNTGNFGIQTNWWKVANITQDEIDTFKNLGWIFIPDGSIWGLDPVPYLAFNSNNTCSGQVGGSSTSSTSNSSTSSNSTQSVGGGDVLGAYTEFANTGTMGIIVLFFGVGCILIGASILTKSKTSRRG